MINLGVRIKFPCVEVLIKNPASLSLNLLTLNSWSVEVVPIFCNTF